MKEITINNQKEWDELPNDFEEFTHIKIVGKHISINKALGNTSVEAWDNTSVRAWGNASVRAWDNASVEAFDNASVEAWDNASVEAWDNASVEAWDNASVEAWDNASVRAWGNASVRALGNTSVRALDNASVRAWGNASVRAWGNTSVEVLDNASVRALGNASVEAWDNASVRALGNAIIRVVSQNVDVKSAKQESVIIYQNCANKPIDKDDSASVIFKHQAIFELSNFLSIYDVNQNDDGFILFKSVNANYKDFYTGKVEYKVGEWITAHDWDNDPDRECGGGLHLSPSIKHCKGFNKGKYLKCLVPILDDNGDPNILVHPEPQYPQKIRCRKLKVLGEVFE